MSGSLSKKKVLVLPLTLVSKMRETSSISRESAFSPSPQCCPHGRHRWPSQCTPLPWQPYLVDAEKVTVFRRTEILLGPLSPDSRLLPSCHLTLCVATMIGAQLSKPWPFWGCWCQEWISFYGLLFLWPTHPHRIFDSICRLSETPCSVFSLKRHSWKFRSSRGGICSCSRAARTSHVAKTMFQIIMVSQVAAGTK